MKLKRSDLRDLLFALKGATAVSFVARTDQSNNLKGGKKNPLHGLEKLAYVNGIVNWNYQNSVNNQREREDLTPDFQAEPRAWGKRLHDLLPTKNGNRRLLPLVAHPFDKDIVTLEELQAIPVDQLYLEFKPQNSIEYRYYLNNEEISKDVVHENLRPKTEGKRQQVENVVKVRDYKLNSIESITLQGTYYQLV